jgi:glycosyltransferase involved in cell wall biosynthesis
MLVSIVINNYNYARYIGAAIDSALAQTWRPLEVVVVDDGSTDDSWAVIQGYGKRVHAIRQTNGGQGAAYNTGFAACRGQWVLFLDSDDLLDADAVQRMMALAAPGVVKVQGFLQRIGPDGKSVGGVVPYIAHDGDVTAIARRFRQYAAPPSSGNLYQRSAIEPYFPMPPALWRRSADTVTGLLCAFHGRVATVNDTVGSYRLHTSANRRFGLLGNIHRSLGAALARAEERLKDVEAWGSERTGITWSDDRMMLPWDWRIRALSWRLERQAHPFPNDNRQTIWRGLNQALACWPGYTTLERLGQRAWVGFMLVAPQWCVMRLAPSNASGILRARFKLLRGVSAS